VIPSPLEAPPSPPSARILVVDDEPQIREILAAALARDGYRVTPHANAKEALVALEDLGREGGADLLVTDLKMPEMNGLELIKAARQVSPSIGSILITAFASMETAVLALRGGADDYLMKPFGLDDLRRVVERVLTDRRLEGRDVRALTTAQEENDVLRQARRCAEEALYVARRDLRLSRRDLERRVRDLEFVGELTHLLAGEDVERMIATTASIAARRFHAHVTRIEIDAGFGLVEAEHREGDEPVALPLPLGALLLDRARSEPGGAVADEVLGQGRPLEGMAAALQAFGRPAGGIVLLRPVLPHRSDGDLALLAMIARAMKPAVEAECHRRRAEGVTVDLAQRMLEALEGRGILRRGHADRVTELASRTAARLEMEVGQRRALATAARLHDVGEIGVPEELLLRAGPLAPHEMDVVRAHAIVGARMLEPLGLAATFVRHHHERPDGRGYPDGLVEERIPLGAAVIGVAEAYDAMTNARAYHPTLSPTEARREILRLRGIQFVPRAVDALMEVLPA
jgi:response regulator RpfG family c-di-GMP phosphodiesterase